MTHRDYVLVATLAPDDATTTLFFGHMADRVPLRIVPCSAYTITRPPAAARAVAAVASALAGASAVIFVRHLFEFGNLTGCVRWLGIPRYYFLDDNFMLLRDEPDLARTGWYRKYSPARVRRALRGFSGVLLSTPSLADYFKDEQLHDRLTLYPPVAGPTLDRLRRDGHPLTVAFFGGMHRREPFLAQVYPAVRRLSHERDVTLVVAGIDADRVPSAGRLRVVPVAYNPSYPEALRQVASHGIDILAHPGDPSSHDIHKNLHVLINARALGAVPIFTDTPPYNALAHERVAVLAADTEDGWHAALRRLAADKDVRDALYARMTAYCDTHFGGVSNTEILRTILRDHPAPTARERAARLVTGAACHGLSLGVRLTARPFRRLA